MRSPARFLILASVLPTLALLFCYLSEGEIHSPIQSRRPAVTYDYSPAPHQVVLPPATTGDLANRSALEKLDPTDRAGIVGWPRVRDLTPQTQAPRAGLAYLAPETPSRATH